MRVLTVLIAISLTAAPALSEEPKPLRESTANARQQMDRFGTCVADRSPDKSAQTLSMDFRSSSYKSAMRALARANEDCFRRYRDAMRANNLSFAGAIAERLMERDSVPLNMRIVKASATAAAARSPSDAIAICVVRSAPDDVARLFATDVASDGEKSAIGSLQLATRLCSRGQQLETTVEGMRAMLATAAFRTVNSLPAGSQ